MLEVRFISLDNGEMIFVKQDEIKVSVIIPIYNIEKYLEECLHSVLRQTLDNVEIAKIIKWVLDFSYPYNSCIEYNSVLESILLHEVNVV